MEGISNLSRNTRHYREVHGWSLRDLAERSGIDKGTLSRLERGEGGYSVESVHRLCTAFGVSEGVLFADQESQMAKMVRFRSIPVLGPDQIIDFVSGRPRKADTEKPRVIAVDNTVSSRAFAFEGVSEEVGSAFEQKDCLIIDPKLEPAPGDFVLARTGDQKIAFRQYRVLEEGAPGKGAVFELVPLNSFYPVLNSALPGLQLLGTLAEMRRYRKASRTLPGYKYFS